MHLLDKYLPRTSFSSYEDFKANYRVNVPPRFNFGYDVVDEWARLDPEKQALVWMDDAGEIRRYTFADVKRRSAQAANALAALGIGKGDVVMLILKQRPEVWFTLVGLMKLGAIAIPASYLLTGKDISYRCNAARAKMLITVDDPVIAGHAKDALPDCTTLRHVAAVGENVPDGWLDFRALCAAASGEHPRPADAAGGEETMLIYFTSGTTGWPKMIVHDFNHPIGHIVTAKYWQHVQDNGLHLTAVDSGWAKFGWGKIYGQWMCGSAVAAFDTEKFMPEKMLAAIEKMQVTTFCAPATVYRFMIHADVKKFDLSRVTQFSMAGEPLNPEVFNRWMELTGKPLVEGFGQTEGTVLIANFGFYPIRPGSTGRFAPVYDLEIVNSDGTPCEDGEVGHIVIRHANSPHPVGLFREYLRDPEAMAASWKDGNYDTGDMAWRDADGYIWFVGRSDDIIKCSGYRIGPFEVESALMEHDAVIECAVTAAPDPVRGQVVKATIVLKKGYAGTPALVKELQDHVKKATAPYKYPRIVEFVDELPKTHSGKVRRKAIRQNDATA
jgi:acetyl-CoA synthetase